MTTKPIMTFYTLDKLQPTFEASALFVAMNLVLVLSWLTFSPGAPYRRPFYTNREGMADPHPTETASIGGAILAM